jgi:hypothetical protein
VIISDNVLVLSGKLRLLRLFVSFECRISSMEANPNMTTVVMVGAGVSRAVGVDPGGSAAAVYTDILGGWTPPGYPEEKRSAALAFLQASLVWDQVMRREHRPIVALIAALRRQQEAVVYTTNLDGLLKADVPDAVELHGSLREDDPPIFHGDAAPGYEALSRDLDRASGLLVLGVSDAVASVTERLLGARRGTGWASRALPIVWIEPDEAARRNIWGRAPSGAQVLFYRGGALEFSTCLPSRAAGLLGVRRARTRGSVRGDSLLARFAWRAGLEVEVTEKNETD